MEFINRKIFRTFFRSPRGNHACTELKNPIHILSMLVCMNINALTTIEPPVKSSKAQTIKSDSIVKFNYTAEVYSDLRWRGLPLTAKLPGWTNFTTLSLNAGRFESFASVNGYAYTTDPPKTNPTQTETDIAYMMAESKIGSKIIIGDPRLSKTFITFARGIYMWPGASVWKYKNLTCTTATNTSAPYLEEKNDIKPVKSIDVGLSIYDFKINYSTYDVSSQNQQTNANLETPSTQIWGDYFYIQSPKHQLSKAYSYDIEYGYWQNTGRHFDFNINVTFNEAIEATIKSFNFRSFGSFENSYGITGIMKYTFF